MSDPVEEMMKAQRTREQNRELLLRFEATKAAVKKSLGFELTEVKAAETAVVAMHNDDAERVKAQIRQLVSEVEPLYQELENGNKCDILGSIMQNVTHWDSMDPAVHYVVFALKEEKTRLQKMK